MMMWDVNLLKATRTIERTMAFVFYRWLVFLGIALGLLLATLAGAGTAIGVSSLSSNPTLFAAFGAIAGFLLFLWVLHKFRPTLFHSVIAGHQFLLAKVVAQEPIPEGKAQLVFAHRSVNERMPSVGALWEMKTLVTAALSCLPFSLRSKQTEVSRSWPGRLFNWASPWLSGLNADVTLASSLVDRDAAPWAAARSGVLAQARHLDLILKNRAWLLGFEILGWIVAYAVLLIPFQKIAGALPFQTGLWPHIFALVFGWNIKASFFEPITLAAMIELRGKLAGMASDEEVAEISVPESAAFRQIASRAATGQPRA